MTYDDIYQQKTYKDGLPIERLAENQINRVMEYRSKKLIEYFEESVDALIDLLPPEVEQTILDYKRNHNIEYNLTLEGKEKYILLFREIKKQLCSEGIVWRKSSFSIGHD